MDCFIGNVPAQCSENQLEKFLRGVLAKLSIKTFECRKFRNNNWAIVTFLHINEAQLFLRHYGLNAVQGQRLRFLSSYLACKPGNKTPDEHTLRSLAMQDKKSKAPHVHKTQDVHDHHKFESSSLICGTWNYSGGSPVFTGHTKFTKPWTVNFGKRNLTISIGKQECRVTIAYSTIQSVVVESEPSPSMTLSLLEAPTMSTGDSDATLHQADALHEAMAALNIRPGKKQVQNNAKRVCFLSPEHEAIVSTCLVYRLSLSKGLSRAQMYELQRIRDMPPSIFQHTQLVQPAESHAAAFRHLLNSLANPPYNKLPFAVRFQVQKLAQNAYLLPVTVRALLPEIAQMVKRSGGEATALAVRKLFSSDQIPFAGPETEASALSISSIVSFMKENEDLAKKEISFDRLSNTKSDNVAVVFRATITPAGCYLYGPEPEASNRVLRQYSENIDSFLRVTFGDENGEPVRFNSRVSNDDIFYTRFVKVLKQGIEIAGRKYSFLGFSHSSLRAQSCWFMAPFFDGIERIMLLDRMVIARLGDFSHIRSPAKCAARIGQAFSDSREVVTLDPRIVTEIDDVERNGRVFSDGVGTFSTQFLQHMRDSLPFGYGNWPTCFQIRYKGAKGMLSLDSRLQGNAVVIRKSMVKFEGSDVNEIEICGSSSKPLRMYLNRQLIKILEDCGVDGQWFLRLQRKAVRELRSTTESPVNAAYFLQTRHVGDALYLPFFIRKIDRLGMPFYEDDFLKNVIEMMVLVELRTLKYRSRILVDKGHTLYGIMDETGTLEEGEVFVITSKEPGEGKKTVVKGDQIVVTRSPALHPGDMQVVKAIDVPLDHPLRKLSNCICFSQKGERDLPSQLSGGDLDGDLYHIIYDPEALPHSVFDPADYPRAKALDIGRRVEKEDMIDFFVKFMATDQLGRIATMHQILADQKPDGTLAPECLHLANMHSTAVDYSKTGIPVDLKDLPKFNSHRPDFMAPGPHVLVKAKEGLSLTSEIDNEEEDDEEYTEYKYYESTKILGTLYRDIDELSIFEDVQRKAGGTTKKDVIDEIWRYILNKCRSCQWTHHVEWAQDVKDQYEEYLLNVMVEYAPNHRYPLSELEVFIGQIVGKNSVQDKRHRDLSITMKDRFDGDVAYIVDQIIRDENHPAEDSLERAMACLSVSFAPGRKTRRGDELVSFKYVAAAVCLKEVERTLG